MALKKDFIWTLIRSALQIVVVFATQTILARSLGPEGRGSYAVCWTFMNILMMFMLCGLDASITFNLASKRLSLSQVYGGIVWLGTISSVLGVSIACYLIDLPLEYFQKAQKEEFFIAILSIVPFVFFTFGVSILRGMHKYYLMNIFMILQTVLVLLLTVLNCLVLETGVKGALYANFWGALLTVFFIHLLNYKQFSFSELLKGYRYIGVLLHYGFRAFFSYFAQLMNIQLGTLVTGFLLLKSDIGFFSAAIAIVSRLWIIPDSMYQVLMPRLASDSEHKETVLCEIVRVILIMVSITAVAFCLVCKPIILLAFGEDFLPVVYICYILSIGVIARSATKLVTAYFFASDRPGINSITKLFGVVLNIALVIVFTKKYGLYGAAFGTTLSYLIEAVVMLLVYKKVSNLKSCWMFCPKINDLIRLYNLTMQMVGRLSSLNKLR